MRDGDAAEDQRAARDEGVGVPAFADSHVHGVHGSGLWHVESAHGTMNVRSKRSSTQGKGIRFYSTQPPSDEAMAYMGLPIVGGLNGCNGKKFVCPHLE
jgi:hypothetical protein